MPSTDLAASVARQLGQQQVLGLVHVVQSDARQVGLHALVDRDVVAVGRDVVLPLRPVV